MKKSAVFILINDIHIDKSNGELVKDVFRQVIDIACRKEINRIIIGGDIFTNRSGQPLDCLSTFQDIIDIAEENDIVINAIPGNHDKTDPDDDRSYIDIYRGNRLLTIRRKPDIVTINGCLVAFMPYYSEDKWLSEFKNLKKEVMRLKKAHNTPCFLITHVAINGVLNNDGTEVNNDLNPSMFGLFAKVFVGHYHNASKVGENVYYTGSAYQGNFGETLTDKGCIIAYNDGSYESIPLKFPQYIKHVIDVNDTETLRNLIEKYDGEDYNHIRFVIRGNKVDASKVDLNYISSKGIDCKYESVEERENIDNSIDVDALNYDKRSITKDFLKFCSENNIKGKQMKYGLNLIKGI